MDALEVAAASSAAWIPARRLAAVMGLPMCRSAPAAADSARCSALQPQRDGEAAPHPWLGNGRNLAAHQQRQRPADRQSQAGPAKATIDSFIGLAETVEEALGVQGREPDSRVLDHQRQMGKLPFIDQAYA